MERVEVGACAEGPEPRVRALMAPADGSVARFERLEGGRLLRYALEPHEGGFRVRRATETDTAVSVAAPAVPPPTLVTIEVLGGGSGSGAEAPTVGLRLRGQGGEDLQADLPRQLLQRLVLGPALGGGAGLPLPPSLAAAARILVLAAPADRTPPWRLGPPGIPGEEDPRVLAAALNRAAPLAGARRTGAMGADPTASPGRWGRAPSPGSGFLVLPPEAFPGPAQRWRARFASAWPAQRSGPSVPGPEVTWGDPLVLVSAEPPGLLGLRLRSLARDPRLEGRALAVWSLGGPLRRDLPASLLAEGRLAAVGVVEHPPVALPRVAEDLALLARALPAEASPPRRRKRARKEPPSSAHTGARRLEDLPGPLVWWF
jgi:hypothetical protein